MEEVILENAQVIENQTGDSVEVDYYWRTH